MNEFLTTEQISAPAQIDSSGLSLAEFDPQLATAMQAEENRQRFKLELIASENYASPRILTAQGSLLTNKYAEGYPRRRYYGGCEHVDVIESLAIDRACELFSSPQANVQAHSGSQANMAAYLALLQPGDRILGMDLSHGGHLTHGAKVSFSGFLFEADFYGVDRDSGRLDYDQIAAKAKEFKPKLIIAGASAYSRVIDFKAFRKIADEVGAYLLTDMAHIAGLVAASLHPSPVPHSHITTSTTHKTLRGPRGGLMLSSDELIKKINSKIFPGLQGGPLCHVIAAKALAFGEALRPAFRTYMQQVLKNATALSQALAERGYDIVSGGTDNHLLLVDLRNKGLTGKEAEQVLDKACITVNKNTVPFETLSPFITSGIRLGCAALSTRGFKENDLRKVAEFIDQALTARQDEKQLAAIAAKVTDFAGSFPLFAEAKEQTDD